MGLQCGKKSERRDLYKRREVADGSYLEYMATYLIPSSFHYTKMARH